MKTKSDYTQFTDAQLVSFLREGDSNAFVEIFSRFRALLFLFTVRRLEDKELTKDLIHDAFADIWEKRQTINIPGDLQAFLITMIKNRILDHFKRKKVSQRYLDNFNNYLRTHENSTDHLVRHNSLSKLIEKEIAALPEKMRIVFELSRKKELTRKQIAEELNIPQETVNSRMRHTLAILKQKLSFIVIIAFILIQ